MKKLIVAFIAALTIISGCKHNHNDSKGHYHDKDGNHISSPIEEDVLKMSKFTLYTNRSELFMGSEPFVVGRENQMLVHMTSIGEVFKAITDGTVSLIVKSNSDSILVKSVSPYRPGIFKLSFTPAKTGVIDLIFKIKTASYEDRITIDKLQVFQDVKSAIESQANNKKEAENIAYLKEQAWNVEFASTVAKVQPFAEVIRTSGQIIPSPNDEATVSAQINGLISYATKNLIPGSNIKAGCILFTIKNNEITKTNLSTAVQQAEQDVETARAQFTRAGELVKDKIISEKEFLETKLRYENAQSQLSRVSVSKKFNQTKQTIVSPISGFIKNLQIENGQFVQEGQSLLTISKSNRLLLRADVSQKYFPKIHTFNVANFKYNDNSTVFSTRTLNGKLISSGKSTVAGSAFLPVYFKVDNKAEFIPGSIVEVFLQSGSAPKLIIPYSAILEEMGTFYVYVQLDGEAFEKRQVKIGATDGIHVEILSGLREGERVVSKGAYQIKLSSASGSLPTHSHEH
ncbi:MAG: efflux RND transporter periplasmic adaptor subunit [Saprospiraceae bacterium]|nr:efflux RND transporter periplasmic adaptor subunit [Saprospiraceae bacterium]